MYDKTLFLVFENAGLFRKHGKYWNDKGISNSKYDRVYNLTYKEVYKEIKPLATTDKRTSSQWIDVPIGKLWSRCVANMLCVLAGRRPSPAFRNSIIEQDKQMFDIATRSVCKVGPILINKNGKYEYVYESQHINKAVSDAWDPSIPISWYRLRKLCSARLFQELETFLAQEIGPDFLEWELHDVVNITKELKDSESFNKLRAIAKEEKGSCLIYVLKGTSMLAQDNYQGLGPYLRSIVKKGVGKITRLDGEVAVPLTNDEVELFRGGNGIANILDGGLVTIDEVVDYYEPDLLGYKDLYVQSLL